MSDEKTGRYLLSGLTIGIHSVERGGYAKRWGEALQRRDVCVKPLDLLGVDPLGQVQGCDGVMWHWQHYPHEVRLAALPILRVIEEHLYIPIFPSLATCWHYDDKIAQSYLLLALDIPEPKTWVFWRKADALAWCKQAEYPMVVKLSVGAGSSNVLLLHEEEEAQRYVEKCFSRTGILIRPPGSNERVGAWKKARQMVRRSIQILPFVFRNRFPPFPTQTFWMPQKNYALFQEFLPDNEYDTRVTVIGNRAFAYRRFNRPNDFRASGSGDFQIDPQGIDLRCIRIAFEAARKLHSQSMAFDFMFRGKNQEPVVGEVSYCYVDWMVEKCPGHWDSELNWHEGHLWPEEAHVEDFLAYIQKNAGLRP